MIFGLKPLGNQFFNYLNELAEIIEKLDRIINKQLKNSFTEKDLAVFFQLLNRKKVVEKHMTQGLTTSFITPFDREDIINLTCQFSHLIQNYRLLMIFLHLNNLSWSFLQKIKDMLNLLTNCAVEARSATAQLINLSAQTDAILAGTCQLNNYCNRGQESACKILSELYIKEKEFAQMLKCRDLIQIVLAIFNDYETISWTLRGVIVKYA